MREAQFTTIYVRGCCVIWAPPDKVTDDILALREG